MSGGVQVNEDITRFGALAGADDAAFLQLIHDARRSAVGEAQATLEERGGPQCLDHGAQNLR